LITTRPPLLIAGIPVKGLHLEFNHKQFYLYQVLGRMQSFSVDSSAKMDISRIHRNSLVTRIGYGMPDKSHLHAFVLWAKDAYPLGYEAQFSPLSNQVLGLEAAWKPKKFKQTQLFAEYYQSLETQLTASDSTWNLFQNAGWNATANRFLNASSRVGMAGKINLRHSFFQNKTLLSALYQRVGAQYRSLGAPFLIRDRERYELMLTQKLGKSTSLNGFLRKDRNQLQPFLPYQTQMKSAGLGLQHRWKKGQSLQINWAPYVQESDSAAINAFTQTQSQLLSTQIQLPWGEITKQSTTISASSLWMNRYYEGRILSGNTELEYEQFFKQSNFYFTLRQQIDIPKVLQLSLMGNYSRVIQSAKPYTLYGGEALLASTLWKVWKHSLGGQLTYSTLDNKRWNLYHTGTFPLLIKSKTQARLPSFLLSHSLRYGNYQDAMQTNSFTDLTAFLSLLIQLRAKVEF
jgi:hypothetical protein